ncbi:MAG: hemerythrin domain-containing protein [Gemmataceae bacterium]
MNHRDIAQQTRVENNLLGDLMNGLRAAMSWEGQSEDFSRQLSTVRFIAQCFQRHVDRLMALEEYDGYMDVVTSASPQLAKAVDALRHEHDEFRAKINRLVNRLERISPLDRAAFTLVCDDLRLLLDKLEEHGRKEARLMQEALDRDEGGEG